MPPKLPLVCRQNFLGQTKRIIAIPPNGRRAYATAFGYQQAKALVYAKYGPVLDVLDLHAHSIPPPHSSLITLRTLCTPVNPADINSIEGVYPIKRPFITSLSTAEPVAVPGNEACFEVVATGSSVKSVKPGDWVIPRHSGLGTWRTHVQVDEETVFRVNKEGLTPAQVATISVNPVTAWLLLKDSVDLQEGDWFIQNGANSGVGRALIQFGKARGLKSISIIRTTTNDPRTELFRELEALGATKVISETELCSANFPDQLKQWTDDGREKVRLGLNCVGGAPAMRMITALSPGAHCVTYGGMSKSSFKVSASNFIFGDLKFTGFWLSRWAEQHREEKEQTVEHILDLYREGKFQDPKYVEFPWNWDTPKAELVKVADETLHDPNSSRRRPGRPGKALFVFGDTEL